MREDPRVDWQPPRRRRRHPLDTIVVVLFVVAGVLAVAIGLVGGLG